jgi:hypothetical protein
VIPSLLAFGVRLNVELPLLLSVNISRTALPIRYVARLVVRVSSTGDAGKG